MKIMNIWEGASKERSYGWEKSRERVGENAILPFLPVLSVSPKDSPIANCFVFLKTLVSIVAEAPLSNYANTAVLINFQSYAQLPLQKSISRKRKQSIATLFSPVNAARG